MVYQKYYKIVVSKEVFLHYVAPPMKSFQCVVSFQYFASDTMQDLKDKSGVDKIIIEKQPYQLLNTSREFSPTFQASNFHKFDD